MTHLRYKDYQGSVTFVDGTLFIQILHIDDLITTECENAPLAQAAFEDLVDDYIQTCAEMNKSPSKPFKGSFNVRIPPYLHRSIAMQASEGGETMNQWIQKALEEKIERATSYKRLLSSVSFTKVFQSSVGDLWNHEIFVPNTPTSPVLRTDARSVYYSQADRFRN